MFWSMKLGVSSALMCKRITFTRSANLNGRLTSISLHLRTGSLLGHYLNNKKILEGETVRANSRQFDFKVVAFVEHSTRMQHCYKKMGCERQISSVCNYKTNEFVFG